jgi:nucleotide-binding universal stress UspA family protein
MPNVQKILYATDLSPNSTYVLHYAMDAAIRYEADIVILHVFEQFPAASSVSTNLHFDSAQREEIFNDHVAKAREILKKRLDMLCGKEFKDYPDCADNVKSIDVCEGFPAEEILNKAVELNCDLIIMGTHGKGILAHPFLGSTAKRVLRRTRKPVFIVPLPKEKAEGDFVDI